VDGDNKNNGWPPGKTQQEQHVMTGAMTAKHLCGSFLKLVLFGRYNTQ
jgi:hypothetical protein